MTVLYLDSSAAFKLLRTEPESAALSAHLDGEVELCSARLLETELRRAAQRSGVVDQALVTELLGGVALFDVERKTFGQAGLLPGEHLRSLDALHLATALAAEADAVITYDARMTESAISLGLTVVAPS